MTEMTNAADKQTLSQYSPTALAFIGDAVYELLAREYVIAQGNRPAGALHFMAVELVSAHAQSGACESILPMLAEEEETIFRRGRNSNSVRPPRSADPAEYRRATGLEALFGWLYMQGRLDRINELFKAACESAQSVNNNKTGDK